jgi:hypothetical protein
MVVRVGDFHRLRLFAGILFATLALPGMGGEVLPIHGLWVWKGPAILAAPQGAERLRDFCRAQRINEVYVSVLSQGELEDVAVLAATIELLHRSNVRVEALLSSIDADEVGKHRDKLLDHVRAIMKFNQQHRGSRIDGIHLDIEPQQRTENKGAGNLRFLPGLAAAYRAVRALAEPAGLTVNADIQNKLLKGSADERRVLLQSVPRLTLMLYELNDAQGNGSFEEKAATLRAASRRFLDMAYGGLHDSGLAQMVIGLRTPDYGDLLPRMLENLDEANGDNTHYLGWARHSYNDVAEGER